MSEIVRMAVVRTFRFAGFELPLPSDAGLDLDGREVILGIRPADLEDAAAARQVFDRAVAEGRGRTFEL